MLDPGSVTTAAYPVNRRSHVEKKASPKEHMKPYLLQPSGRLLTAYLKALGTTTPSYAGAERKQMSKTCAVVRMVVLTCQGVHI